MHKRALIVGCGITGSVIARELSDHGYEVEILEKRDHIGGNMYDYTDEHGFLVSKYGPHAFHTNDEALYEYVQRYEEWEPYRLKCMASWDGKTVPTPFNFSAIDAFYPKDEAEEMKAEFRSLFSGRKEITVVDALKHENPGVRAFAEFLFHNDYAPYTAKQWDCPAEEIDPAVLKRVPIRMSYEEGYFNDRYQIYPKHSYSRFFRNLLNAPGIRLRLSVDALRLLRIEENAVCYEGGKADYPVVYTGAVDELFGYAYGSLPYRSLEFKWQYDSRESFQEEAIVAYPKAQGYTRITEYKKLPVQAGEGTVYAIEYPKAYKKDGSSEAYYPVLTEESSITYERYRKRTSEIHRLYCCGRLGDFRYYNMDQALREALGVAKKIIEDGEKG